MGVRKEITQTDRVLRHLKDKGKITSWEAIREYGITRLSAKIFSLKKEGHKITFEWVWAKNRYKEPVRFKRYILDDEERFSFFERLRNWM